MFPEGVDVIKGLAVVIPQLWARLKWGGGDPPSPKLGDQMAARACTGASLAQQDEEGLWTKSTPTNKGHWPKGG